MVYDVDDTIAAIASASGPALRGIVRISGPDTLAVIDRVVDIPSSFEWPLDTASTLPIGIPLDADLCIESEILVWPTNRSFTRQPAAEIHTVGALPVLKMIMDRLIKAGCRHAEPGEFTMRAFLSGRLDLTQAEAVLGVIDARNERQFNHALQQMAGGIRGPITLVRDQITGLLAELEAGLDFVEEDIEFVSRQEIQVQLRESENEISRALAQLSNRQVADERVKVVFAGRPNAGKSSLFNALAKNSDTAIVSDIAGTTRDYLTADVSINGIDVQLIDTAGLENEIEHPNRHESEPPGTKHSVHNQMADQAAFKIRVADITLLCLECGKDPTAVERQLLELAEERTICVRTKCDLDDGTNLTLPIDGEIRTSVQESFGITELKSRIGIMAEGIFAADGQPLGTLARTSESLGSSLQLIRSAILAAESNLGEEIIASELRIALNHLGKVVGAIYTDDLLDIVFSRFCIGK